MVPACDFCGTARARLTRGRPTGVTAIKKMARFGAGLAFALVCIALMMFLHRFTDMSGSVTYLEWDSTALLRADGTEQVFDPAGVPPSAAPGEAYRLTAALPPRADTGTCLLFEVSGLDCEVWLDGQALYASAAATLGDAVGLGRVQLPLPSGGGEQLVMLVRAAQDAAGVFPPLLRITADPTDNKGSIAYANYYALPAGALALALALLWGIFLLGLTRRQPDWHLLLPIAAAACLIVQPLATAFGAYFFPPGWLRVLGWRGLPVLALAALVAYLALQREQSFRRALGWITLWSAGVLLVCWAVSAAAGGYLAGFLASEWSALVETGYYNGLLYWLTVWLVVVCAALSTRQLVHSIVRMQTETHTLALKNQLAMDNYRHLEEKLRESAALRHEFTHQLTYLSALYGAQNWAGIGQFLETMQLRNKQTSRLPFTPHEALDAMLQNAADRAEKAGVRFEAAVSVPRAVSIPDGDLCTFFMNLLDNALEAAAQAPEGRREIRLRASIRNGFLGICCENGYNGRLVTDSHGRLATTKADPEAHGFGLTLMRQVAEKYGSILDISCTDTVFTVQTALKLPG